MLLKPWLGKIFKKMGILGENVLKFTKKIKFYQGFETLEIHQTTVILKFIFLFFNDEMCNPE